MFKELISRIFKKHSELTDELGIAKLYLLYKETGQKFVNLNNLAKEIRDSDTGEKNLSITQIKETLGILGRRWREKPVEDFIGEIMAIYERAGKL